jgi:hypothetical protein
MNGRFSVDQVPMGGKYRVRVSDHRIGHENRAWGDVIEIDRQQPSREVRLVMPEGVDLPVQVLGPGGKPVPKAEVSLNFSSREGGLGGARQTCDTEGRYTFRGVNFDLPVEYYILAAPTDKLCGMKADVVPRSPATTLQLRLGVKLEGVLINDKTGEPMAGKIVEANPADYREAPYSRTIETGTDDRGRFSFQNLHPIVYRLRVDNMDPPGTEIIDHPDGRRSIRSPGSLYDTLKVELPRQSEEPYELRLIPRSER